MILSDASNLIAGHSMTRHVDEQVADHSGSLAEAELGTFKQAAS